MYLSPLPAHRITESNGNWVPLWLSTLVTFFMCVFPPIVSASGVHDTSHHLYHRVMEEYKHGDYEAALAGFQFFLELHPKTALAPSAQYWIGECQYRLGRYHDALKSFSKVGAQDALSQKRPASMFKIGQTYAMLGDYYRARLALEDVIDQFPGGPEAQLAGKAIAALTLKTDLKRLPPVKQVSNSMR